MKLLFLILSFILTLTVLGANIGDDTVNVGQKGSTEDKLFIFRDANSTQLGVNHSTGNLFSTTDQLTIGDGTDTDKKFVFDIGSGSSNPFLQYDQAKSKIRFSNDGSTIKDIGSGSGAGGENYNNAFTADQNANAEDGTTGWTASAGTFDVDDTDPLEGEQSFVWTPSAQNDTLDSPVLNFDRDIFKGRSCEARIDYIGGDENLSLKIINGDDETIGVFRNQDGDNELPAHIYTGTESVFFRCPTDEEITADADKGNLYFQIENTGASASPLIKFDKAYSGTLLGLVEVALPDVLSASFDGSSGASVTRTTDGSNDTIDCTHSGTGNFSCTVSGLSEVPSVACNTNSGVTFCYIPSVTSSSFNVRMVNDGGTASNQDFNVILKKQGTDAKKTAQYYKSIPKVAQNENVLSARINGSADIITQNVDWLDSCSVGSGTYNCSIKDGIFDVNPVCSVQHLGADSSVMTATKFRSVSTTLLKYSTQNDSDSTQNNNHYIICQKQETDYKTPTVQPILVNQVTNSYAESTAKNVAVEGCAIINSGTPTVDRDHCDSWIDSITDSGIGHSLINIKEGSFIDDSFGCTCTVGANALSVCTAVIGLGTARVYTRDGGGSLEDRAYSITCIGER